MCFVLPWYWGLWQKSSVPSSNLNQQRLKKLWSHCKTRQRWLNINHDPVHCLCLTLHVFWGIFIVYCLAVAILLLVSKQTEHKQSHSPTRNTSIISGVFTGSMQYCSFWLLYVFYLLSKRVWFSDHVAQIFFKMLGPFYWIFCQGHLSND